MKVVFIFLLTILQLATASKRLRNSQNGSTDIDDDDNRRPLKRLKAKVDHENLEIVPEEAAREGSLDDFPEDLLLCIALQFLEDYPLRLNVRNPLGYLHVLSKTWSQIMTSKVFVATLRSTPNAALHLLNSENFHPANNRDILNVAAPILNAYERRMAIISAEDCDSLRMLASLPSFRRIEKTDYELHEMNAFKAMEVYYPNLNRERTSCYYDDEPLEISDQMFILTVPQHLIVRLLFLDDLYRPLGFTWIFFAVAKSICHIYFNDRRHLSELARWIKNLSGTLLPYSKLDLTCEIMIWPMALACLLKDWEFLELLNIDFDHLLPPNKDKHAFELAKAIGLCLKTRNFDLSTQAFAHFEIICSYFGSLGFMGFDNERLKTKFRDLLPYFGFRPAIERVQDYLL